MPDICPETEKIWRCDCGGPHFVHVIRHEWEGGGGYFGVEDYSGPVGWRERIGEAWKSLMGQQHPWSELILTPQIAREIAAELEAAAVWLETGGVADRIECPICHEPPAVVWETAKCYNLSAVKTSSGEVWIDAND